MQQLLVFMLYLLVLVGIGEASGPAAAFAIEMTSVAQAVAVPKTLPRPAAPT
jgi:hypothetical protein